VRDDTLEKLFPICGGDKVRNDYMGIYQEVYPEPGKYYPKLKKELNAFLNDWLKNMIDVQNYQCAAEHRE
jgi:hypothetical protein